jgi:hypothetical protein
MSTISRKMAATGADSGTTYHFSSDDLDDRELKRVVEKIENDESDASTVFLMGPGGKRTVKLSDGRYYDVTRESEWAFSVSRSS